LGVIVRLKHISLYYMITLLCNAEFSRVLMQPSGSFALSPRVVFNSASRNLKWNNPRRVIHDSPYFRYTILRGRSLTSRRFSGRVHGSNCNTKFGETEPSSRSPNLFQISPILLHFKMWMAQRQVVSKIETSFSLLPPP